MSSGQIAALAGVAVLVFWMLGAYNRLVQLRGAIHQAFVQIDEQLRRRRDALPALVQLLREALPLERLTLDAVLGSQNRLQAAADTLRARPVVASAAAALTVAEGELGASLASLLVLLDQHVALRDNAEVAAALRELHDTDLRLAFARQLYNDAVLTYNAALQQFPTRLLRHVFGFVTAGPL